MLGLYLVTARGTILYCGKEVSAVVASLVAAGCEASGSVVMVVVQTGKPGRL